MLRRARLVRVTHRALAGLKRGTRKPTGRLQCTVGGEGIGAPRPIGGRARALQSAAPAVRPVLRETPTTAARQRRDRRSLASVDDDARLLERLRSGDEAAFVTRSEEHTSELQAPC